MDKQTRTNRALAKKITNALFTVGTGQTEERGQRLKVHAVQRLKVHAVDDFYLGGWCREAATSVVLKILNERKP